MIERVTIKIPKDLYDNTQKKIEKTGFSSVTEFIVFLVRSVISNGEYIYDNKSLSQDEIDAIRSRLKKLGYF